MEQSCPGSISHYALDMAPEGEEGESAGSKLHVKSR